MHEPFPIPKANATSKNHRVSPFCLRFACGKIEPSRLFSARFTFVTQNISPRSFIACYILYGAYDCLRSKRTRDIFYPSSNTSFSSFFREFFREKNPYFCARKIGVKNSSFREREREKNTMKSKFYNKNL